MAGLTLPHFKAYCKATVTNAVLHWEEESIGVNLSDPGLSNGFLAMTLKQLKEKAQVTKGKETDKWHYIKIKSFCASKDTIE